MSAGPAASARSGMTIPEMAVSLLLLVVLVGGLGVSIHRGTSVFRTSSASAEISARAGRSTHALMRTLLGVSASSLDPATPAGASSLEMSEALDYVGGVRVDGPVFRIAFELETGELDNGADDDGDGLVDEGAVVRVDDPGGPGESRRVLVSGVRELLEGELDNGVDDNGNGLADEAGLCFELDGNVLTVRLSLTRPGPDGGEIVRTQQASLALRNP